MDGAAEWQREGGSRRDMKADVALEPTGQRLPYKGEWMAIRDK